jgi:1-deoxy-D-xylulose 5-phosphate reductoisomerase
MPMSASGGPGRKKKNKALEAAKKNEALSN